MKRTTCYKLLYALGVSQYNLSSEYFVESRVCGMSKTFVPSDTLKRFRALSAIFTAVMRNYSSLADLKSFRFAIRGMYAEFSEELGYNPVAERGTDSLLDYVNRIVLEHSAITRRAYLDLEIAMPYSLFVDLTEFPQLDSQKAAQLVFLMSKTNRLYGLYFYGRELFNVSLGSMLQDDLTLRDRLSLYSGERLEVFNDRSSFGVAVSAYLQEVFISRSDVQKYSRAIVYARKTVDSQLLQGIFGFNRSDSCLVLDNPKVPKDCRVGSPGTIILTSDARWAHSLVANGVSTDIGVLLPIESRFYKQWRRRKAPNVYLINR